MAPERCSFYWLDYPILFNNENSINRCLLFILNSPYSINYSMILSDYSTKSLYPDCGNQHTLCTTLNRYFLTRNTWIFRDFFLPGCWLTSSDRLFAVYVFYVVKMNPAVYFSQLTISCSSLQWQTSPRKRYTSWNSEPEWTWQNHVKFILNGTKYTFCRIRFIHWHKDSLFVSVLTNIIHFLWKSSRFFFVHK